MTKWIRKKHYPNKLAAPYHLPFYKDTPLESVHYLSALCQCEVKDVNWDVTEDPPESECCAKCLQRFKWRELK